MSQRREVIGGVLVLSTGLLKKSTSNNWLPLNGVFRNFGLRCLSQGGTVTSAFTVKVLLGMSTAASTMAPDAVTATSANVGKIKISTGNIPASYVKLLSTKLTSGAGGSRKLRVELAFLP